MKHFGMLLTLLACFALTMGCDKAKNAATDVVDDAKDKAGEVVDDAKEKAGESG